MSLKKIRKQLKSVIIEILSMEANSLAEDPLPELFSAYEKVSLAHMDNTESISGLDAEKLYRQEWLKAYSDRLGCNLQEAEEVLLTHINWYDYPYLPAELVVEAAKRHAEKMFAETVAIRRMYLEKHGVS